MSKAKVSENDGSMDVKKNMTDYIDNIMSAVMNAITKTNDLINQQNNNLKLLHKEFSLLKRIRKEVRKE